MPLYFAYGLNMDIAAMAVRCPNSQNLGLARLARFRFFIAGSGNASVAPASTKQVQGLLWDVAFSDMRAVDSIENIASVHKVQQVVITKSGPRRALVYIARANEPGITRGDYMPKILAAAQLAGLPTDYLYELSQFSHGAAAKLIPRTQKF